MEDFQDKVAVITGGASGLGREMAIMGAQLGMKLAIADIHQDALDKVKAELQALGAQVLALCCDVRYEQEVKALAEAVRTEFNTVNVLFNNAGVGCGGLIWENSASDWEWVLGVNLKGIINCVHVFMPLMLESAKTQAGYKGHIVNTASMAGLVSAPVLGVYNVSKHAAVAFSESLYHDLKLIRVPISASVLCPYFVPTGINQSERNRPDSLQNHEELTLSQKASQALLEKAVRSGKVSARQVAEITFDAVRNDRFYIFTHPESIKSVQHRMDGILSQEAPYNPYADMPHVGKLLSDLMNPPSDPDKK